MREPLKFIGSGYETTQIMTSRYAVLGSPIKHSLSPQIHNHVFSMLGKTESYEKFDLATGLVDFLDSRTEHLGFSLTMPLKDAAFQVSAKLSDTAQHTQSVNTLFRIPGGWAGFNTDVYGIREAIGFKPETVAVLGSGATARSALAAFPESRKLLSARNAAAAEVLAKQFDAELVDFSIAIESEVVLSTLPVGVLTDSVPNGFRFRTILDAAYMNPRVDAQNYVSGIEMLLLQAIAQQRIFNGQDETQELPNEAVIVNSLKELLNVAK